jgi:hypothetical protein
MRFSVPEDMGRITAFVRSNSWVCREAVARDGGAVKNLLPQSRKDRIGCDQRANQQRRIARTPRPDTTGPPDSRGRLSPHAVDSGGAIRAERAKVPMLD